MNLDKQLTRTPPCQAGVQQKGLLTAPSRDLWCTFSEEALGRNSVSHWAVGFWNRGWSCPCPTGSASITPYGRLIWSVPASQGSPALLSSTPQRDWSAVHNWKLWSTPPWGLLSGNLCVLDCGVLVWGDHHSPLCTIGNTCHMTGSTDISFQLSVALHCWAHSCKWTN